MSDYNIDRLRQRMDDATTDSAAAHEAAIAASEDATRLMRELVETATHAWDSDLRAQALIRQRRHLHHAALERCRVLSQIALDASHNKHRAMDAFLAATLPNPTSTTP